MAKTPTLPRKIRHPYVTRKKGVCGGKPIVKGSRMKVAQIAIEYDRMGWSPNEIAQAHPHLTLAQVHDALSYYYDHVDEINEEVRSGEQLVEELQKLYPQSPLELRRGDA